MKRIPGAGDEFRRARTRWRLRRALRRLAAALACGADQADDAARFDPVAVAALSETGGRAHASFGDESAQLWSACRAHRPGRAPAPTIAPVAAVFAGLAASLTVGSAPYSAQSAQIAPPAKRRALQRRAGEILPRWASARRAARNRWRSRLRSGARRGRNAADAHPGADQGRGARRAHGDAGEREVEHLAFIGLAGLESRCGRAAPASFAARGARRSRPRCRGPC